MSSSSSSWGGWGTKLNVTSIVTQGLEQVRSLREDVEKSFDQVVTGAPESRASLSLTSELQQQKEDIHIENDAVEVQEEVTAALKETSTEDEDPNEVVEGNEVDMEEEKQEVNVVEQGEEQKEEDRQEDNEGEVECVVECIEKQEESVEGREQQEAKNEDKGETQVEVDPPERADESGEEDVEQVEIVAIVGGDLEVAALQKELAARELQLLATSATIRELHDELDKTCHREVAAVERAQFLTEQLENMRCEVAKLTQLHKDTSSSQGADAQALQMALAEKEERLSALLDEGQALSVKMAQLEQRLRSLRKERDELEERVLTTQSQAETSAEEVKGLEARLKASEEEKTRLTKENHQLASNAESTSIRAEKAEQKVLEVTKQLEALQVQLEEVTYTLASKDDEVKRLKTASQSNEALNHEKAELQQTLQFLQDNVRDLENEAARREEMARTEITDLKRKWQDAVARVDMLGQSVSEATQPLLRQIHTLQEDQRAKQDSWKVTESTLTARIEEVIEQHRIAEQEKLDMEQQLRELQHKVEENEVEMTRQQAEFTRLQDIAESAKAEARELRGKADALRIDLDQAKHQRDAEEEAKQQLQTRLDNIEESSRHLEASSTAAVELEQCREREARLRQDLEWHKQELQRLKNSSAPIAPAPLSTSSTSSQHYYVRRSFDGEQSNEDVNGELSSEASILKSTLETVMGDTLASNGGNTSVLGLSQLHQRLRLREGENRMLKQQLETLETRQKQTTDEIVRLSTRNALLEAGETRREQAQLELVKLQKHQVVLLELFGEKEEQVEELQAEVKELKDFYRKQLDTLATHNEEQRKQQAEHPKH